MIKSNSYNSLLSNPGLLKLWVATPFGFANLSFGLAK